MTRRPASPKAGVRLRATVCPFCKRAYPCICPPRITPHQENPVKQPANAGGN